MLRIFSFFTAHAQNGYISTSNLRTFSVDFSSEKQKVRHISTSGLFGLLT